MNCNVSGAGIRGSYWGKGKVSGVAIGGSYLGQFLKHSFTKLILTSLLTNYLKFGFSKPTLFILIFADVEFYHWKGLEDYGKQVTVQ